MTEPAYTKIPVKIYGQEYTVASTEPKDRVARIAAHVDEVMRDLTTKGAVGSVGALAMLAAINISEELFNERDAQQSAGREREQLDRDIAHYQQLWEEAKRTHLQYKEDAKAVSEQKDALQERLNQKTIEVDGLIRKTEEQAAVIARLEGELASAVDQLRNATTQSVDTGARINELQDKLKEIEGNYFELQMENIQMKGDLERYRGGQ
ncbi:MAG: cell division protein ZapA [Clostridiales Family XIII bacterium]|jgi:cell division protein ZapA (FtsZ GTPase activity inhibitor)|nr:cell division protein ZapA [Clostridiales Family XIII bacterium]